LNITDANHVKTKEFMSAYEEKEEFIANYKK